MATMFPDGIHADGRVYPIVPGGYAVVGEQHAVPPHDSYNHPPSPDLSGSPSRTFVYFRSFRISYVDP
jgi:hypothetical protein